MALTEEMKLAIRLTATDSTKQAFGQLNSSLNGLKNTALQVAAVVGGALAFRDIVDTTQRLSTEIDMLKDNFGMTAEQASKTNFALKVVGASAEDFTTAVAFLNKKIIETIPHIGEQTDDFHKWGISILDANGGLRATGDVLGELREKMQAAGPGQAAMGMAFDLMGRSNRTLTEFMQLTNAEMADLAREAADLGQVLSEAGARDLKDFNRQMNRLGIEFDGLKLQIGRALLPILKTVFDEFRRGAGVLKAFAETLKAPLGIIKEVIERLSQFIGQIKAVGFSVALQQLLDDVLAQAKQFLPKIGEELDKLGPLGWALKILLIATAVEFAAGIIAGVAGQVIAVAMRIPGVGLAPEAMRVPLAYTLATGLLLAIVATEVENDLAGDLTKSVKEKAEEAARLIVVLAGIVLASAAAFAVAVPFGIAVGVGLLLGIAALEFGSAAEAAFGDLGPRFLRWLADSVVPHLPFPAALVGAALRISIPVIWDLFTQGTNVPAGPQGTPPGANYPPHGGLAGPTVDLSPGGAVSLMSREAQIDYITRLQAGEFGGSYSGGAVRLMAEGGAGVATRPTLFVAGERGPEAYAFGRAAGGVSIGNITINGDVTRENADRLAEQVAQQVIRRMRRFGQPGGSPTSAGGYF